MSIGQLSVELDKSNAGRRLKFQGRNAFNYTPNTRPPIPHSPSITLRTPTGNCCLVLLFRFFRSFLFCCALFWCASLHIALRSSALQYRAFEWCHLTNFLSYFRIWVVSLFDVLHSCMFSWEYTHSPAHNLNLVTSLMALFPIPFSMSVLSAQP